MVSSLLLPTIAPGSSLHPRDIDGASLFKARSSWCRYNGSTAVAMELLGDDIGGVLPLVQTKYFKTLQGRLQMWVLYSMSHNGCICLFVTCGACILIVLLWELLWLCRGLLMTLISDRLKFSCYFFLFEHEDQDGMAI